MKASYADLERKVEQRTQELTESRRELEAASRHKSEFLASMSHELRTPLNAIIGFSEVLQERMFGDVNEKQAEYLEDIHGSGTHLLSLINDILDLSKIEAGRMDLELSRFDIARALDMHAIFRKCAEGWRKRGYDLSIGIGIAQGYATLGAIGFEGRLDYGAIGLVCNLASRLCAEANGGQTLVTQRVLAGIEDVVEVEPLGERALRGFQRPVTAFKLWAESARRVISRARFFPPIEAWLRFLTARRRGWLSRSIPA